MSAAASLSSRAAFLTKKSKKSSTHTSPAAAARSSRRGPVTTPPASIARPPGGGTSDATAGGTERAKVSMVSLGCPKNTVDGEVMLGDLFANGFDIVDDHEESDAIIINTCGFVEVGDFLFNFWGFRLVLMGEETRRGRGLEGAQAVFSSRPFPSNVSDGAERFSDLAYPCGLATPLCTNALSVYSRVFFF